MGVFDYIKTEMPLPAEPPPPQVEWFQTKDVPNDCLWLEKWVIRADGRLVKLGVRYEDHSDKTLPEDDIGRLAGMMTPILDRSLDQTFDFHGDISFGHLVWETREDWDYVARFTDGICTKIWCEEYTPPDPAPAELKER
jgi:hypothetical protein